ncbi:MAG: phage tail protein [Bacteroidota bacterium]|nr:phage tail protein [Bacteroidota bacterium]
MFLTFGNITFQGIKLPTSFESSFETIYGQIPIIGTKPVVQGIGEKLDEHDITAYFHTDFCTPRTEVNAMQAMRKSGTVAYLVDGTGKNYGRFVITTLQESKVVCLDNGYETAITVQIHLLEYNTNASVFKQKGSALASQNPVKVTPIALKASVGALINADVLSATQASATLQNHITESSTPSAGKYQQIVSVVTSAKASITSANAKVEATKKVVFRAMNLRNSFTMVNSALDDVKAAATIKNYNDLLTANNKLTDSLYYMNKSYAPVAAFIGSREGGE